MEPDLYLTRSWVRSLAGARTLTPVVPELSVELSTRGV